VENTNIHIARSWRKFGKEGFVSIYGIFERLGHHKLNFHIAVEPDKIDMKCFLPLKKHLEKHGHTIQIYKQDILDDYARYMGINQETVDKFKDWQWIYHILLYHRLFFKDGIDYILTLDDDLVFNHRSLSVVESCCVNKVPFSIADQFVDADKCMMGKLCDFFGGWISDKYWSSPGNEYSGNSGFMGVNNGMWEFFATIEQFNQLIRMFTYREWNHKIHSKGAKYEDYRILLQEQSFLSILNRALSNNHIVLVPEDGYLISKDIKETESSIVEHYVSTLKYKAPYLSKVRGLYEDYMKVIENGN
jgi:hypothetical protein